MPSHLTISIRTPASSNFLRNSLTLSSDTPARHLRVSSAAARCAACCSGVNSARPRAAAALCLPLRRAAGAGRRRAGAAARCVAGRRGATAAACATAPAPRPRPPPAAAAPATAAGDPRNSSTGWARSSTPLTAELNAALRGSRRRWCSCPCRSCTARSSRPAHRPISSSASLKHAARAPTSRCRAVPPCWHSSEHELSEVTTCVIHKLPSVKCDGSGPRSLGPLHIARSRAQKVNRICAWTLRAA